MLSTIALVVAGLSSGHKIGLAVVGAAFIGFALVSSFLIPRYKPDFPGRNVGLYVTVCVLFFIAMVSAVIVFGRESKEASAETTSAHAVKAPKGDPAAGKGVFQSAGCSGCHTLKAANASGTVGPNLDTLKPPFARIVLQVTNGGKVMPSFKARLSAKQIDDVAAFVFVSTHS